MNFLVILLVCLAILYVALNVRRLRRGRRWAFTVCQVGREWEQREHEKRLARRAAGRAGSSSGVTGVRDTPGKRASARGNG